MTLILTVFHCGVITQVVDRLTTIGTRPYDVFANKNVVYCPRNAMTTLAYTGLAKIDGVPTDEWIAGVLWGERVGPGTLRLQSAANPRMDSLGQGIERLRAACEAVYRRLPVRHRAQPLEIVVAGFQRTARSDRKRPVLWTVRADPPGSAAFATDRRAISRNLMQEVTFEAHPSQPEFANQEGAWLWDLLQRSGNTDWVESAMVEAIRRTAARLNVVGSEAIVITIDASKDPQVVIQFAPSPHRAIVQIEPDGTTFHPIAFSPFILTTSSVMKPTVMGGGGFSTNTGGIVVEIRGDANNPNGFMYAQPRGLSPEQLLRYLGNPPRPKAP